INELKIIDLRVRKQHKFFMPFIQQYERNMILTNDVQEMKGLLGDVDATFITYDSMINEIEQADILYICDLPNDISVLENILQQVNPVSIHISYHVEESAFFNRLSTRDEFKWLFVYALQYSPLHLKVD